jgi:hypothetical protein
LTLRDQYEADRDLLLSTELPWVQSVAYNGNTVSASFQIKAEDTADGRRETAELIVSAAVVAVPAYRDTVVYDGTTWHVMKVLSSDGVTHKLELYSGEQPVWTR